MGIRLAGAEGQVRWVYHIAAVLGSWTLEDRVLTATIKTSEDVKLSQQPLNFFVPRPGHPWVWPIESLQIADGTLTATVGPQERR